MACASESCGLGVSQTLGIQSYSQVMSKGCSITETKRIVFIGSMLPFSVSVSQDPEKNLFGC